MKRRRKEGMGEGRAQGGGEVNCIHTQKGHGIQCEVEEDGESGLMRREGSREGGKGGGYEIALGALRCKNANWSVALPICGDCMNTELASFPGPQPFCEQTVCMFRL